MRLLGGEPAAALQAGLGREPWRGRIPEAAARELFDWPRLNAGLAEQRFDASRLYLSGAGAAALRDAAGRVDAARLTAALREGATLILNAANEASPPLRALCEGLAADITCVCQANLYACWRQAPGFDVHWDDHDVIVVQVEGRKRWALYGATREAPLIRGDPPDHRPPPQAQDAVVLQPGDVLYLPRGYWHAAVGVGEPSLHLTIGLTRRTGADFLHWLADRLLSQAVTRRDLPFEQGEAAVAERLAEVLAAAAGEDLQALAAAYRRHVEALAPAAPALSFPAIGGEETAPAAQDALTLASGAARLEPGTAPDTVVLAWRGTRFTLSAALEPLLRRLAAGEAITFGELAMSASPERALEFVREMLGRGVLQLRPRP